MTFSLSIQLVNPWVWSFSPRNPLSTWKSCLFFPAYLVAIGSYRANPQVRQEERLQYIRQVMSYKKATPKSSQNSALWQYSNQQLHIQRQPSHSAPQHTGIHGHTQDTKMCFSTSSHMEEIVFNCSIHGTHINIKELTPPCCHLMTHTSLHALYIQPSQSWTHSSCGCIYWICKGICLSVDMGGGGVYGPYPSLLNPLLLIVSRRRETITCKCVPANDHTKHQWTLPIKWCPRWSRWL